jgi:chromosome segregation ATPase
MWIKRSRFRELLNELDAATNASDYYKSKMDDARLKQDRAESALQAARMDAKALEYKLEQAQKWTRQRDPKTGLFVKRSNSYQSETAKF